MQGDYQLVHIRDNKPMLNPLVLHPSPDSGILN